MTLAHDALADLQVLACEAALDQSLWPQVAEEARTAFRADHTRLAVVNPDCSAVLHAQSPQLTGNRLIGPPYLSPKAVRLVAPDDFGR